MMRFWETVAVTGVNMSQDLIQGTQDSHASLVRKSPPEIQKRNIPLSSPRNGSYLRTASFVVALP